MTEKENTEHPEPPGSASVVGFVKSNPRNNDHYLAQYKDDAWYPIIERTHRRLEAEIPGYNIAQIKEKFGGLRYYYDLPENIEYGSPESVRAEQIVAYAEAWVDGFEHARRMEKKRD